MKVIKRKEKDIVNGQQRLLLIFLQLLSGKKVNKFAMMAFFDKQESTIQRDIVKIEDILSDKVIGMTLPFNMEIERDGKGNYQLNNDGIIENKSDLTDIEILAILKIIFSTRILTKQELINIVDKLLDLSQDTAKLKQLVSNERFYYEGIAEVNLLDDLEVISQAIVQHNNVVFEYTKNGETQTFERLPKNIYFSDLYFFMISSSQRGQDDKELDALNKFRVNNMKNIRVVPSTDKRSYNDKFEGGLLRRQTYLPFLGNPITMVIDFYYDPVYVLNRFPDSKIVNENEDGSVRIEMQVNDGYGMKMWLASQSHMVKIISPKHMRDYIIQDMKDTLKLYDIDVE